eukprot:TRINITY_DN67570_c5_g1_i1.p1 TRINITY_DN67570_c5_g1~~TRINITY_DN67570_c5_g1_i1.p1  ORF type:complete len:445 (+),score=13.82 TRINITY_DN67570_c5_g1_i1:120-1337(+)
MQVHDSQGSFCHLSSEQLKAMDNVEMSVSDWSSPLFVPAGTYSAICEWYAWPRTSTQLKESIIRLVVRAYCRTKNTLTLERSADDQMRITWTRSTAVRYNELGEQLSADEEEEDMIVLPVPASPDPFTVTFPKFGTFKVQAKVWHLRSPEDAPCLDVWGSHNCNERILFVQQPQKPTPQRYSGLHKAGHLLNHAPWWWEEQQTGYIPTYQRLFQEHLIELDYGLKFLKRICKWSLKSCLWAFLLVVILLAALVGYSAAVYGYEVTVKAVKAWDCSEDKFQHVHEALAARGYVVKSETWTKANTHLGSPVDPAEFVVNWPPPKAPSNIPSFTPSQTLEQVVNQAFQLCMYENEWTKLKNFVEANGTFPYDFVGDGQNMGPFKWPPKRRLKGAQSLKGITAGNRGRK